MRGGWELLGQLAITLYVCTLILFCLGLLKALIVWGWLVVTGAPPHHILGLNAHDCWVENRKARRRGISTLSAVVGLLVILAFVIATGAGWLR